MDTGSESEMGLNQKTDSGSTYTLETGSIQKMDPGSTCTVGGGSTQETDPGSTRTVGGGSTQKKDPGSTGTVGGGSTQKTDPGSTCTVGAGSTQKTDAGCTLETESNQKMDLVGNLEAERVTLAREAASKPNFEEECSYDPSNHTKADHETDDSEEKNRRAHRKKRGACKGNGGKHKGGFAKACKKNKGDGGKVGWGRNSTADSANRKSVGSNKEGVDGIENDGVARPNGFGNRRSTRISRQKVGGDKNTGANHQYTVSPKGAREELLLACDQCGKEFTKPSLLKEHCSVHSGQKSHPCPVCGRRFRLNKYVTQHIQIHAEEKTHICSICGKAFSKLSYLKTHAVSHSTERPHLCTTCGKRFSTPANLRDHMGIHEGRSVTCSSCGKTFTHRSSLNQHVKTEHGSPMDYTCKVCGKVYKGPRRLKKHSLIHNKPYSCAECDQKFSMKYLFLNHMRKHTGEKPYHCTQCGQTFRVRPSLIDHLKKQHQNTEEQKTEQISST